MNNIGVELEIIDLDALVRPIGRVRLDKELHDVLPINGRGADLLQQIATGRGDPAVQRTWLSVARTIIADCIPTLTIDQVKALSIEQVTATIGIATKQADNVRKIIESMEGNASPESATPILGTPVPSSSVQLALQ